jgi:death on curing protein
MSPLDPEPRFLDLDHLLKIHRHQIAVYGGSDGLRDQGLLASACAQPRATFGGRFLHEDLAAMAAAYLYHLVSNHAFVDGNKRIGGMAAVVFLRLNGHRLTATEPEFEGLVMAVASGQIRADEVAIFIRHHLAPLTP